MHQEDCSGTPCSCHPLADVPQRADRATFHNDGHIPTLVCKSWLFSFTLKRFLSVGELHASMGYGKIIVAPCSKTAARDLLGNGYAVPVCAVAVAAAATVVGRVVRRADPADARRGGCY